MRWLFIVFLVLTIINSVNAQSSKRSEEVLKGSQLFVDRLHGYSVELQSGWYVRIIGNSIVIGNSDKQSFIQIRGVRHNGNIKQVAQRWLLERQMINNGNAKLAFRQIPQGIMIVGENLGFPHFLSPMASINAGLDGIPLPSNYRDITLIMPNRSVALVVSFLFPAGTDERTRRQMVEMISTFKFLPPKEMVSWREEVIVDPETGMEALRLHIPKDFEFRGNAIVVGTIRTIIYVARKGEMVIRTDTIRLATHVIQSGYMASGRTILNINGQASQQPQPIFLSSPEDSVKLLSAIWKAATGRDWQIVEIKPVPESEYEKRLSETIEREGIQRLSMMGAIANQKGIKLAYLMRSGELVQSGFILGSIFTTQSPHPIASTQDQQVNLRVLSYQCREREQEWLVGILNGILASEYINPEYALSSMERFVRDNKALNRMVREMVREHREANSRMATTWSNLLSDQTYIKDPQMNEIYRVHKNSWETGNFWREPVFGDVILGGVKEGSKLEELLRMEGWRRMTESLEGFPEMWK